MASGISSHLFSCVPCVSFFAEGRHFNIPLNSINDEEHTKVQSVGCTKKVTSNLLHGCPASALLLPKGNFYLLWYQADFQLCHQTGTPQLISTIVAYKEGNTWMQVQTRNSNMVAGQKKNKNKIAELCWWVIIHSFSRATAMYSKTNIHSTLALWRTTNS